MEKIVLSKKVKKEIVDSGVGFKFSILKESYTVIKYDEGERQKDSRYDDYTIQREIDGKLFIFEALMSDSWGFHNDASDEFMVEAEKEEQASNSKRKWISVKDRLPENDRTVLVLFSKDKDDNISAGYIGSCGHFYPAYADGVPIGLGETNGACFEEQPTHWYPLDEIVNQFEEVK